MHSKDKRLMKDQLKGNSVNPSQVNLSNSHPQEKGHQEPLQALY